MNKNCKNTNRYGLSISNYLKTISKMPQLSAEEMLNLVRMARQGNMVAREKLINANLGLAFNIAAHYEHYGLPMDDLISEGNMGLIKAVEKFDVTQESQFAVYAMAVIRQSILDAIERDGRLVKLPHNQSILWNKIKAYISEYESKYWEKPSVEKIAEHFEMEYISVMQIMNAANRYEALDAPLDKEDEESDTRLSTLVITDDNEADSYLVEESNQQYWDELLNSRLTEREAFIVRQHYGFDGEEVSQIDIANKLCLSRERVRQLESQALSKLRDCYRMSA